MRLPIRILDRLVVGQFLRLFLGFVLSAPLLFILGDVTENLDQYLNQGVTFWDATVAYLYEYPQFFVWAFPIAALLAAVFTIHPMTAHREIMAAKAGGISFYRLALPLFVLGAILFGVDLALSDVAPRAMRIAADLRGDQETNGAWRSDFVYITDSGESLSARRLTVGDGQMVDVTLQDLPRQPGMPVTYTQADRAQWWEGEGWIFQDGYRRDIYPGDRDVTVRFESALVRSVVEGPEDLLDRPRDEDEMTYGELQRFAARLVRSGGKVGRTLTKMEQRFAIPAAAFVIILFGAPLATSSRRGGATFGIGLSLATFILYIMLFRVSAGLGYAGTLSPRMAAWLPNAVFLAAALVLLKRVRT
jgi:lipopolysaccharide export system permease protein